MLPQSWVVPLVAIALLAAPAHADEAEGTQEGPPPQAILAHGMMDFAAALFNKLAQQHGNIVVAPFHAALVMEMAARGAKGSTAEQIAKTFGYPDDPQVLHEGFSLVSSDVRFAGSSSIWRFNNRLWLAKGLDPKAAGPSPAVDDVPTLHLEAEHLNAASAKPLTDAVNTWAKENTDGHVIRAVFPEAPLNDTRALIGSAMRMGSLWRKPARARASKTGASAYLQEKSSMYFGETPDYKVAELELATDHTSLLLLIPKDASNQLTSAPDGASLRSLIGSLQPTEIAVEIPVFHMNAHVDLTAALKALGVTSAFGKDAEFPGWGPDVRLADMQQSIDVSVDADGANAAVATYVRMGKAHAKPWHPVKVNKRIGRSFLFILRDTYWSVPLLFGRVEGS